MTHETAAPQTPEHPYARFLERVEKPSRYVGGEHGEIRKDWGTTLGKLCLAFPDVYDIGMSHLGFKILYGIVNGHEKLLAERCYAPWSDMGGMPVLVLAGLIEGTIRQLHAPLMPYWAKLLFALVVDTGLFTWLLRAGRTRPLEGARADA